MNTIKGDLLALARAKEFDVIVHGCNCFHNFGVGIARQIMLSYPLAFEEDKKTSYGDRAKLGTIVSCYINHGMNGQFHIVNAYSQFGCNVKTPQIDYVALRNCFKEIKNKFSGKRIGYPKIGAGLAGGDWNIISKIIDEELSGENHTFVEYQPQGI